MATPCANDNPSQLISRPGGAFLKKKSNDGDLDCSRRLDVDSRESAAGPAATMAHSGNRGENKGCLADLSTLVPATTRHSGRAMPALCKSGSAPMFNSLINSLPAVRELLHKVVDLVDSDKAVGSSVIPLGHPLFEAFPPAVFFVGFEPTDVCEATVKLRNKDRVSRRVRVLTPDSVNFATGNLDGSSSTGVAPGMSTSFVVKFKADGNQLYSYDLTIETERERFLIPLRAFKGLASLDLPGVVSFGATSVGLKHEKAILVTNDGTAASRIAFDVSPPFGVQPQSCYLPSGEAQQVIFSFEPKQCGHFNASIKLTYDDGREELRQVHGEACESPVTLSGSHVRFGRTFVNLSCEHLVYIENDSDEHVPFSWSFDHSSSNNVGKLPEVEGHAPCGALDAIKCGAFSIKPACGRVWAKSKRTIRLEFMPDRAIAYSATALCNIAGRANGLPLHLHGVGTGPEVRFTEDEIDLDEVVVFDKKCAEVDIVNMGDIAACFSVRPLTESFPPGGDFSFSPSNGYINVNKAERLRITFRPSFVGDFEAKVFWAIESCPEDICLRIKGRVIPPPLETDIRCVDFGVVPFGFEEIRSVALTNVSEAPQTVRARVMTADEEALRDITLDPEEFVIEGMSSQKIDVMLRPSKAQTYFAEIAFDLPGLVENHLVLPLKGSSKTPKVALEPESVLSFDDVFLHTPSSKTLVIRNTSRLSAQYSICIEPLTANLDVSATPESGLVPALSSAEITVTLCPRTPGEALGVCKVYIAGIDEAFVLNIQARACGPKLKVEPKELDWAKTACLEEVPLQAELTNVSPIPATIRCSIRGKHNFFEIPVSQLTLDGGATTAVTVVACFAEAIGVVDQLVIAVADGQEYSVTLKGQGVGSPVVLESFESTTDFYQVCTHTARRKCFEISNKGTRARQIIFNDGLRISEKGSSRDAQLKFTVRPNDFTLEPQAKKTVEIEAFSAYPGRASQVIMCQEFMGFGVKPLRIARTVATADFFTPTLIASPPALYFKHLWTSEEDAKIIEKVLKLTNPSTMLQRCKAKASPPFYVHPESFSVGPKEAIKVLVKFDTTFNGLYSSSVKGAVDISFREHPKIDTIPVEAEVEFPNVELDTSVVDFGCIVNETTMRIPLSIKNTSTIPVTYGWYLSDTWTCKKVQNDESEPLPSNASAAHITKIFDFTPFTGTLDPGASEIISVRYWGLPYHEVSAVALCCVENGPEYPVRLLGRASVPRLKVSPTDFDFKEVPYLKAVTAEVVLTNYGLVNYNFSVDLDRVVLPWTIEVPIRSGVLRAKEKMKLAIKFLPGLPTDVSEVVVLEVDHFDPIPITLRAKGIYSCLLMGLPRADEGDGETHSTVIEDENPPQMGPEEAELDRKALCKIMLNHYNSVFQRKPASLDGGSVVSGELKWGLACSRLHSFSSDVSEASSVHRLISALPATGLTPGRYQLDMGSIVVGQARTKVICMRNASTRSFSMKINKRALKNSGFAVEPEALNRIAPNERATLAVTAKQDREGEFEKPLVLHLSGGLTCQVMIKANFVVPDLKLSTDTLDFGNVKRGTCKTMILRLRNKKSVPAQWRHKTFVEKSDKAQNEALKCFTVEPTQSLIMPGEWLDVKVHFWPEELDKRTWTRLYFCIEDNPKWKSVVATGVPLIPNLEFSPPTINFGHFLPLQTLKQEVVVRNMSDAPCELYSMEFDEDHKEVDKLLRLYEGFDESGVALLPVRPPGKICWSRVRRAAQRKIAAEMTPADDSDKPATQVDGVNEVPMPNQEVVADDSDIDPASDESSGPESEPYPYRVLLPDRQSALVLGPASSGKTSVSSHLTGGTRRLLTLDECVDWVVASATKKSVLKSAGPGVYQQVQELLKAIEGQESEGDMPSSKKNARQKVKGNERRAEDMYAGVPLPLLSAAVRLRVAQPDCYAGTVFRVSTSLYCASPAEAALAIVRALDEDIAVLTLKFGPTEYSPHEKELMASNVPDGLTFYRTLLSKQIQQERELTEMLEGQLREGANNSKLGGSASSNEQKKKKQNAASDADRRVVTASLSEEEVETLKQELTSVQHFRQRLEPLISSAKAAQAFVQEQISMYTAAEAELKKECTQDNNAPSVSGGAAPASAVDECSSAGALQNFQRSVTFAEAFVNAMLPLENLLVKIEPLREPVIPPEPPIAEPAVKEVVRRSHHCSIYDVPENVLIMAPCPQSATEKSEEDDAKNKPKKSKEPSPTGSTKTKQKPEKTEEETLATRLASEPAFSKVTRFVLEPHSEVRLLLKCSADKEGDIASTLHFKAIGDPKVFKLEVKASCSLPRIENFPLSCFEKAVEKRLNTQILKKTFIMSEGTYDFGPLLAGRPTSLVKSLYGSGAAGYSVADVVIPPTLMDFVSVLTLRNSSPFTTTVRGCFAGGSTSESGDNVKGRKTPKTPTGDSTFLLFPPEVTLAKNATGYMHLWCLPKSEGEFSEKLLLTLSDNPQPFEVKVLSHCTAPRISLKTDTISFGRVVAGRVAKRMVTVENPTPFPLKWSFTTQESSAKSFTFSPASGGIVDAFSTNVLEVSYEAPSKAATTQTRLTFRCTDVEGITGSPDTKTLTLLAEAFSIDAGIELQSKTRVLDFGCVQAYHDAELPFTLYNRGKYAVNFNILLSNQQVRKLLEVVPHQGEVKPGEQKKGVVRLVSKKEVRIDKTEELSLTIADSETGCQVEPPLPPIQIMAHVAFNEVAISPPRGLNFGPVESGKTSTLSLDIENKGLFPFDWYLVNQDCMFTPPEEAARSAEPPPKAEKARSNKAKPQGKMAEKLSCATYGPFKITPARGQLEPGSKITVQAEYSAQGDASHSLTLALLVDGVRVGHGDNSSVSSVGPFPAFIADPQAPIDFDHYGPIRPAATYFLQAQSNVPCISLEPESLFQEQQIVPCMEDAYSIWRKRSATVYVEDEKCLCFGPLIAGPTASITETIRIDNPQLIPAEIAFEIKSLHKGTHEKNANRQENGEVCAFDVQPKRLMVAPHDYSYATLTFRPTALQQYNACLRICVEKASNSQSGSAQIDIRGEGTLPSISLSLPISLMEKNSKTKSHLPFFDFGRVSTSRTVTIPVIVKNEGIVSATARANIPSHSAIDFDMPPSLTLHPGEQRSFMMTYHPRCPEELDYKFHVSTHANPFEDFDVQIKGFGYTEELTWSLLKRDDSNGGESEMGALEDGNHLVLTEVLLGEEASQALVLCNKSNHSLNFELNNASLGPLKEVLTVSPSCGSIGPTESCTLTFTFKSNEPLRVERHLLVFNTASPQALDANPSSTRTSTKLKAKPRGKQTDGAQLYEAQPDEVTIFLSAATDLRRCELSTSTIDFETTALFKTRMFSFSIVNPSAVSLPFELFFEKSNAIDDPSFYKLSITRGCIPSGGTQEVQITFCPIEIVDFNRVLVCSYTNFHEGLVRLSTEVTATALRPICHLELPRSDYLERRSQNNAVFVDTDVAVLEIEGVGVNVQHARRIWAHNPTAADLEFEWDSEGLALESSATERLMHVQPFKCVTRRGKIPAGKKTEIIFEYYPTQLGICEGLWRFSIPSKQVSETVMLVGRAKEPHVSLEPPRAIFPPALVGRKVEETLRLCNREGIPITFHFDRTHLEAVGPELKVTPGGGVVRPGSTQEIKVEFCPTEEKPISTSITCMIDQKHRPLRLDVKGEGYILMPRLRLVDKDATHTIENGAHDYDFGCLLVGQKKQVVLNLMNDGKYNFSFRWILLSQTHDGAPQRISVQPSSGLVPKGQFVDTTITYEPDAPTNPETFVLVCEIQGVKTHRIRLTGMCRNPKVSFSCTEIDFGSVFVPSPSDAAYETMAIAPQISSRSILRIVNTDPHHECVVSSPFNPSGIFDFQLAEASLSPEEVLEVPITFSPREPKIYRAKIPFLINDRPAVTVQLCGKGIPIRVEAEPTENGTVKLQPVHRGRGSSKCIHVINRSEKPISFYLKDPDGEPTAKGLSWRPPSSPTSLIQLQPRQSTSIEIVYRPIASCPQMLVPLVAECLVDSIHGPQLVPVYLCTVSGKCFDTEVRLRPPSVAFGSVVVDSWSSQDVVLSNIGELPITFRFANSEAYPGLIKINPSQGTLAPKANTPITMTFRPTKPTEELQIDDIICFANVAAGRNEPSIEVGRLQLTITGRGIPLPADSINVVKFVTNVRSTVTKTFYLKNTKKDEWVTSPSFSQECPRDGAYFSYQPYGPITIAPGQKVPIYLTYSPLTMTVQGDAQQTSNAKGSRNALPQQHSATLFCPLPGGEACCIRMFGNALEPSVEQTIETTAPCKQQTAINIKIKNWLDVKQTFRVTYTILQPVAGHTVDVQAPEQLDIPGSQTREYRFFVSALKPCNAVIRFCFKNHLTDDWTLADAKVVFSEAECMGVIDFKCSVRQMCRHRLEIFNPTSKRSIVQCTSTHPEISFSPQPFQIASRTTGILDLLFRPTLHGTGEAVVSLTSDDLGLFKYSVKYDVRSAGVEKRVTFSAPLGKDSLQSVRFVHFGKKATAYQIGLEWATDTAQQIQKSCTLTDIFVVESKTIQVPADSDDQGTEVIVPLKFVPSRIQEFKAILCLKSGEGHEYKALLVGRTTAPEAQGPLKVLKGKGLSVDFRNPLDTTAEFSVQVDQPAFATDKKVIKLDPRKSATIVVSLRSDARATGRLIVCTEDMPPWIFYLKTD